MFDDYSLGAIHQFVASQGSLVEETPPSIALVSELEPGLDLEEGPVDLLFRFVDDQKPALAFEHAVDDIYTCRYIADRIAIEWVDEME